jgi:hypothetical protein
MHTPAVLPPTISMHTTHMVSCTCCCQTFKLCRYEGSRATCCKRQALRSPFNPLHTCSVLQRDVATVVVVSLQHC